MNLLRWPILLGVAIYLIARMTWEGFRMAVAMFREVASRP